MNKTVEKIGTLGPEASFSHQATSNEVVSNPAYAGSKIVVYKTLTEVCEALAGNEIDRGISPIENSTEGRVRDAVPLFRRFPLRIRGERVLPIEQCAYYLKDVDPKEIEFAISKDNALGQVRNTVARLFPNAQLSDRPSTVAAILEAAQNPKMVGIGPRMAGDIHHLLDRMVRIDGIQDDSRNATRFLILDMQNDEEIEPTGDDKTSLIAQIPDRPGSLFKTLDLLVDEGVNLTKIMSYGKEEGSNYMTFWMDFDGHQTDKPLSSALSRLLKHGVGLRMLGSYSKYLYTPEYSDGDVNMDNAITNLKREAANGVNSQEKSVVAFTLTDQVGALRNALEPFHRRGINLTEIDSLPTGVLGQYIFYLAIANGTEQSKEAVTELKSRSNQLKVL